MWGNKAGWTISALIVAVFVGAMYFLQTVGMSASEMTPKFAAEAGNMQPLSLPTAPESIVSMTDDCDAAPAYRQAIQEYQDHKFDYDTKPGSTVAKLTAADKLVEATHCRKLTLFSSEPKQVMNFDSEIEPIAALQKIGILTVNRALALNLDKDYPGATKYAEAAFALGAKMFNERVRFDEMEAGLGLMGSAGTVLMKVATAQGDSGRAEQLKKFDDARKAYAGRDGPLQDLRIITRNIDGKTSGSRAGDVFWLAQKSPERMWRIEACFQLARMTHNVGDDGHASDQRNAQKILRRLADTETDPLVKAAATRARDMTDAEYNKQ